MKRFAFAALLLLPNLAACGGGGASAPPSLPQAAAGPVGSLSEAQSAVVRVPLLSAGANDRLYIGNTGNSTITVYRHDASGNTPPLFTIGGPKTQISSPGQLSEDALGNLYVANNTVNPDGTTNASVLVFAHGANGNVAPMRKVAGPSTGLHFVNAMIVDRVTGKMFVFDSAPSGDSESPNVTLLRFPPNAAGNEAPFARTGASSLPPVFQLASDATGNNVIAPNACAPLRCIFAGVGTYAKQFANGASLASRYSVSDFVALGIAGDPTTKTYLASTFLGIYRLSESTVGSDGMSGGSPNSLKPNPVSLITSDTCSGQLAVAPGPTPYTYAVHGSNCSANPNGAVYVYANNASGNAAPVRILSGAATKMNQPFGIYEGE